MTGSPSARNDAPLPGPWRHGDAPALVAHRGYAQRYPENTLLALAAAVCCGARCLEFDIQLTRDNVPVLCHDETLRRMAGDERAVAEVSSVTLRTLRAAQRELFAERYRDLPFATLADTVAHLNLWPATTSFVEIKRHSCERIGAGAATALVLDALRPLQRPHVVLSFVAAVVEAARSREGQLTGWVLRDFDDAHRERLERLQPDYVFCNGDKIPPDGTLWPGPWKWVIYEVTEAGIAQRWRARGAAMIESMAVGEMLAAPPFKYAAGA